MWNIRSLPTKNSLSACWRFWLFSWASNARHLNWEKAIILDEYNDVASSAGCALGLIRFKTWVCCKRALGAGDWVGNAECDVWCAWDGVVVYIGQEGWLRLFREQKSPVLNPFSTGLCLNKVRLKSYACLSTRRCKHPSRPRRPCSRQRRPGSCR